MQTLMRILAVCLLISTGCNKDPEGTEAVAVIRDYGPGELDGCGWLLTIGDNRYEPLHLDQKYKRDSLVVMIEYELTGEKRGCPFCLVPTNEVMKIKRIKAM